MNALRQLLIARGAIRPYVARVRPPVLRLDARGKRAAARHIAEYLNDPGFFESRPFWQPPPDDWIDEQEYPRREVSS